MTGTVLQRLARANVAVIGDIMIDVYVKGTIERISPEAPVPVLRAQSETEVPGGAANVAANIAALGGHAFLVGVIGEDRDDVARLLTAHGITWFDGLVAATDRRTIRKQRIMAGQQIVRIDYEDTHAIDPACEEALIARALLAVEAAQTVILSDYGKGALTPQVIAAVNRAAAEQGKIVIVDPKARDFSRYRGSTIITPNRNELTAATGMACISDEEALAAARLAQVAFGGDILLTRSEKGLSWFPQAGDPAHFPTAAREVFDVSGAGDTVVGTLALALAAGIDMFEAIRIANHAAGVVVGKIGTATTTIAELATAMMLTAGHTVAEGALLSRDEAATLARQWQAEGLTVGLANGCFDLIHPGHIALIRQAAAACDRLIMALNTDASVRRLKGASRPVQDEQARAEVMGAIRGVDAVVLFDEDTPYELIAAIQPDVLVKGSDYTVETVVGADVVLARGGEVLLANLIDGQSTSRLIARSQ